MKNCIIILASLVICKSGFSQSSHYISLGPDLGIPTSSLGAAKLGLGGSIQYQIKFAPKVGAQLHIGYNSFTNKYYPDDKVTFLPVRIGALYYLYQDVIFVYVDGGISHYYSPSTGTKENDFGLGAGAGYRIPIGNGQFVQISGYYNLHTIKNYDWFNIRAAYGLSWGKGNKTFD